MQYFIRKISTDIGTQRLISVKEINHPNVVKYCDWETHENFYYSL
jgi:hypothetical protein